jgi:uncharacterized protein YdhG (YjbR/CyaY superfamily)
MSVIDDYLMGVTPVQKKELERVRKIVKTMVPDTEEVISYGLPTLKYKGKNLIHFAAFKDHMSVFPGGGPTELLKEKLKDFKTSKGTIQFTTENPIPEELLKEIILLCIESVEQRSR